MRRRGPSLGLECPTCRRPIGGIYFAGMVLDHETLQVLWRRCEALGIGSRLGRATLAKVAGGWTLQRIAAGEMRDVRPVVIYQRVYKLLRTLHRHDGLGEWV